MSEKLEWGLEISGDSVMYCIPTVEDHSSFLISVP